MPRYHFNLHDGVAIVDKEGTELPDSAAARVEAGRRATRIFDNANDLLRLCEKWKMEVTDPTGLVLFRLAFTMPYERRPIGAPEVLERV